MCIPTGSEPGFLYPPYPLRHCSLTVWLTIAILSEVRWYLTAVGICIALTASEVEHLSVFLLAILCLLTQSVFSDPLPFVVGLFGVELYQLCLLDKNHCQSCWQISCPICSIAAVFLSFIIVKFIFVSFTSLAMIFWKSDQHVIFPRLFPYPQLTNIIPRTSSFPWLILSILCFYLWLLKACLLNL